METQTSTKTEQTEKKGLGTLQRALEEIMDKAVDRAQPASTWSREMLARAERNAAKGLWNAAAQLDRAAKRLDAAGRQLETPKTNGKHKSSPGGISDDVVAPHLA
jgi:excinuclease UvrABC nuclease subunit